MYQKQSLTTLILLLASALTASAAPYVGGALGMSILKPKINNDAELDNQGALSYRAHLGYQMAPKFGIELFYADLGKLELLQKAKATLQVPFKMAGAAVMVAPFAKDQSDGFNWLLELGVGELEIDSDIASKDMQHQLVVGTGLQYHFGERFGVRALYENYDKNIGLFSLGASYHFAKSQAPEPVPIHIQEPEIAAVAIAEPEPTKHEIPDSDGDGVPDDLDCCPNTARGLVVNEFGCPTLEQRLQNINFAYKSQQLTDEAQAVLAAISETMQLYPNAKVELGAHTDSVGSAQYNLKLSRQRAEAARAYLIGKGIDPQRLSAKGYGKAEPIADNNTEDGRRANRRVELKLIDKGAGMQNCHKSE